MIQYSAKELQEAKEFVIGLGIKTGDKLHDSAIEWFVENKRNKKAIFNKNQQKDYVDYIILNLKGGLDAYKRKRIYKSILKEIEAIFNINQVTGNPQPTPPQTTQPTRRRRRSTSPPGAPTTPVNRAQSTQPAQSRRAVNPGRLMNSRQTGSNTQTARGSYTTILDSLKNIQSSLDQTLQFLTKQQELNRKIANQDRLLYERRKRESRESLSESSLTGFVKESLKLFAPIKGILERILNFIVFTILGRTMVALINWMANPENRSKVKSISRFLKDWWPVLLGTYVLFFTQFGKVIRSAVGLSIRLTKSMITMIPMLLQFLKRLGPKGGLALAAVAGVATLGGLYLKNRSEKEEETKRREAVPMLPQNQTKSYRSGGLIRRDKFRKLNIGDIRSRGRITNRSGVEITGAGPDTQLIAAQPGEYIISKAGVENVNKMYGQGFLEGLNKMAGASGIPRIVNNIQLASEGGPVGKSKIRPEDYYSLLAISAAEDNTPQGRADVAQSIYNRLYASGAPYNMSFNQTDNRNTIKDIITGSGQYQPTFNNRSDWMSIRDKQSAIKALAGHLASKSGGTTSSGYMKDAMKMINDTEKALRNSMLQKEAAKLVQGRLSFYGTSERGSMKGDDVIRMKSVDGKQVDARGNSFSHHLADDSRSPYATQRRTIAAPIPANMISQPTKPMKPKSGGNGIMNAIFSVVDRITKPSPVESKPNIKTPRPRSHRGNVSVLPPINTSEKSKAPKYYSPVGSEVPSFNLYPPAIISDRDAVKNKLGMAA
jgi:hypothetical protein